MKTLPPIAVVNDPVARPARAFSLVEIMLAVSLLSLIVLALMAVFNSTQQAFRASVTQTDVLEGSRSAVDLITTDLRALTASGGDNNGPVNFSTLDNSFNITPSLDYFPLQQGLIGSGTSARRTNVLNWCFLLGRENTKWIGVGYLVVATNNYPLYPLYRFYAETNLAASPANLYVQFMNTIQASQWTNLSHVMDGVVHLTVRAYDTNGVWLTNGYGVGMLPTVKNTVFYSPYLGEVGCYFHSNSLPAAVELQMGVLEDRILQRAASIPVTTARSNYLSGQAGAVHLFRQRVSIPNVDPTAYQ